MKTWRNGVAGGVTFSWGWGGRSSVTGDAVLDRLEAETRFSEERAAAVTADVLKVNLHSCWQKGFFWRRLCDLW
eukprot:385009-Rhodomonas_salina.4